MPSSSDILVTTVPSGNIRDVCRAGLILGTQQNGLGQLSRFSVRTSARQLKSEFNPGHFDRSSGASVPSTP